MSPISHLPRTVYVLGDGLLFDDIILCMLSFDPKVQVIHKVYNDAASFPAELSLYPPDVILLNETHRFDRNRLLALLSQVSPTANLRVIVMSLDDNKVHIYDQPADPMSRQAGVLHGLMAVSSWDELFDLIRGRQLIEFVGR